MFTLEDSFFSIVVNSEGREVPVISGLDYDFKKPLELSFSQVKKIKYSEEFMTAASEMLEASPTRINCEIEYDVFPLAINWISESPTSGCLHLANVHEACQSITFLTSAAGQVDEGCINIFEGMSGIEDFRAFVDRYPMRPLSLTAFGLDTDHELAIAAHLATQSMPEVNSSNNELLSAARISFAAAYFLRSR